MVLNFKTNQKKWGLRTTSLIWALWSHQVILLIRFVTDYLLKNIRLFKPKANSCLWSQRIKAWTNLNLPQLKKLWQNLLMSILFWRWFFKHSSYFHSIYSLIIIYPWKGVWPFFLTNLKARFFLGFLKSNFVKQDMWF